MSEVSTTAAIAENLYMAFTHCLFGPTAGINQRERRRFLQERSTLLTSRISRDFVWVSAEFGFL